MYIKKLDTPEICRVYRQHLKRDFPADELKPLFVIKGHIKNNFYQAFGLFADSSASSKHSLKNLLAYAYLCGRPSGSLMLLDYLAVLPDRRSQGLGSTFLDLVQNELQDVTGLVAEVERVDVAETETERNVRQRRLDFYLRAGFCQSSVRGNIFGVDYTIVYRPLSRELNETELLSAMEQLYHEMLPPLLFRQKIHLELKL